MGILSKVRVLRRIIEIGYTMMIVIFLSVIVGLILAWPVQLLWNFVFGDFIYINILQAWALNILTGILFGKGAGGSKS